MFIKNLLFAMAQVFSISNLEKPKCGVTARVVVDALRTDVGETSKVEVAGAYEQSLELRCLPPPGVNGGPTRHIPCDRKLLHN